MTGSLHVHILNLAEATSIFYPNMAQYKFLLCLKVQTTHIAVKKTLEVSIVNYFSLFVLCVLLQLSIMT